MLISEGGGVARFALRQKEVMAVLPGPEQHLVNINNCQAWWLDARNVTQIHVEAVDDYQYAPSHQDAYLDEILADMGLEQGYALDIGANDGRNHSNTFALFQRGWKGLCIETDPHLFARLAQDYQQWPEVDIVRRHITPANLLPLLRAYEVPQTFDFLSLDIDSYDYHVLASLLSEYRPSLIVCEINEALPPPLRFSLRPDGAPDYGKRFYGQSLALLDDLARRHGYAIVHMRYMDAFLIEQSFLDGKPPSLNELFRKGMIELPLGPHYQDYPFDVQALWQASPEQALETVKAGFAPYAGRFDLSLEAIPGI